MSINNISDYSQLEVSKESISQKLNQLISNAQKLNSQDHNFTVYYNERTANIQEHLNAILNDCDEYLNETLSSSSLDDLITQDDLDFLEAGIIFLEFKINNHLDAKSVKPFSSLNLLPQEHDAQVKPLIPENLDELFEMSDNSVDPLISEGPELIDLNRPDGELKGEWFRHAKENTLTYTEAEKEGEKKGLMKMRKWRWLAVAQLPASYPYAAEAYEFYKPYAIDACNKIVEVYKVYAPQVLETVSGWFN